MKAKILYHCYEAVKRDGEDHLTEGLTIKATKDTDKKAAVLKLTFEFDG